MGISHWGKAEQWVRPAAIALGVLFVACSGADRERATDGAPRSKQAASALATLYVAPQGAGDICSFTEPCSLAQAKQRARDVKLLVDEDVTIVLRGGTYFLDQPLAFVPEDSGVNGHAIAYVAMPDEHPVLSGGARIQGWVMHDAAQGIWRAPVAVGFDTRQLYVNGARAVRARGPSRPAGFQKTASGFRAENGALVGWANPSALEVVGHRQWKTFRCPVQTIRAGQANTVALSTGSNLGLAGDWLPDAGPGASYNVGDFNGDGKSDVLFAYYDGAHWRNNVAVSTGSSFTFVGGSWLTDAGQGAAYHIGDFNGDGKSDVLFAYPEGGHWRNTVAVSTGSSFTFAGGDWLTDAGQGAAYNIGDYNGDGKSDVLFAYPDGTHWRNTVAVSTGSSLSFVGGYWLNDAGQGAAYHVGDYNGDGKSDVLFAYPDGGHWHNTVAVSTGSSLTFAGGDWLSDAGQGAAYQIGDYNADGKSDVLFSWADGALWKNTVALSTGSSFGFVGGDWLPDFGRNAAYHVGDFNGDDKSDVLFAYPDHAFLDMQQPCWAASQLTTVTFDSVEWIENAYDLLDAPGEWYLDRTAHMLYYRPRAGEQLSTAEVIAPVRDELIRMAGEVDTGGNPHFVSDLLFHGLTFAYAGWLGPSTSSGYVEAQAGWHFEQANFMASRTPGGVRLSGVQRVRWQRNRFQHFGAVALSLEPPCSDNTIIGNRFEDVSSSAIQIGHIGDHAVTDERMKTARNTVSNNYIVDCAREYESAVGLFVGYSDSVSIVHNEIARLPYTGISVGWGWGQDSYAGNNSIHANDVHDVMRVLSDGGAIYTLSAQPGSTLRQNYLHDIGDITSVAPDFAAIYHDEGTRFYTDTENVVANVQYWLKLWTTSIRNNVVTDNWVDVDWTFCNGMYGGSQSCNFPNNGDMNLVIDNVFTAGNWPFYATQIMDAAGLEPAYASIAF